MKVTKLSCTPYCIPAGVPVIFHADSSAGRTVSVAFYTKPNTAASYLGGKSNGLCGVADTTAVGQGGMLVFRNGVLAAADAPFSVLPRDCYINVKDVAELATGADGMIPLDGGGTPDGIATVSLSRKKEYVDVYTPGGVRVRRHAKRSKALSTLRKGVYIIDGKKRVVK